MQVSTFLVLCIQLYNFVLDDLTPLSLSLSLSLSHTHTHTHMHTRVHTHFQIEIESCGCPQTAKGLVPNQTGIFEVLTEHLLNRVG